MIVVGFIRKTRRAATWTSGRKICASGSFRDECRRLQRGHAVTSVTTEPPTTRRRRKSAVPPPPPLSPIAQAVQGYIDGVLDGSVIAGELIRLAAQRHVDDLRDGPSRGLRFDLGAAGATIEFFSYLKHSKGEWAGQEFKLEPWQMFILWVLFGWLKADGTRRFRTAYVELPRKNGKSTVGAGVGLKLAFADGEAGAEVFSAATKLDQAIIVHSEATRKIKATPALSERIQVDRKSTRLNSSHSQI